MNKNIVESQINELSKQTAFVEYSLIYKALEDNLNNPNLTNIEKQQIIEDLLHKTWGHFLTEKIEDTKYSSESFTFLHKYYLQFNKTLSSYLKNVKNRNKEKLKPLFELDEKIISIITFNLILPILNSSQPENAVNLVVKIGNKICKEWSLNLYKKNKENSDLQVDFNIFQEQLGLTDEYKLIIGDVLLNIMIESSDLIERRVEQKGKTEKVALIYPTFKAIKHLAKSFDALGFHIPMVCPPVLWDDKTYGGYLLNNEKEFKPLIKDSVKNVYKTKLVESNKIYNMVNYMSKVPFRINKNVLKVLLEVGKEKGLLISGLHPLTEEIFTQSKSEQEKIIAHNSKYFLEKNIFGLAQLFSNVNEFYFPLFLDWRGRIYTMTSYLTFQGTELAKSLLEFANGKEILREDEYFLKVYGANAFGKNKLSFDNRVKWIDKHHSEIISLEPDFWTQAKEPFIFLAFCFEYKALIEARKRGEKFKSHLPILLDASCNGIQHLSVMVKDETLAKNVNIIKSNLSDKPFDLYSLVLDKIKEQLKVFIAENPLYSRLSNLNLDRTLIKRSIMTIPYSVSIYGIVEQLEEHFDEVKVDNLMLLKPKAEVHGTGFISRKELYQLAKIIHSILYESHPKLNDLVKYLQEIVEFLTKLGLPVVWLTPSGLHISQKYTKTKSIRIRHSHYKGAPSYNIVIPTGDINFKAQANAIMPNLVHSMDAATLGIMIDKYINLYRSDIQNPINIFTIHDCFATTAADVGTMNWIVRDAFLSLYADNQFIERFHNFIVNYIAENYKIEAGNLVYFDGFFRQIPNPPFTGTFKNLSDTILNSTYLIH